jgi:hypothetical protein
MLNLIDGESRISLQITNFGIFQCWKEKWIDKVSKGVVKIEQTNVMPPRQAQTGNSNSGIREEFSEFRLQRHHIINVQLCRQKTIARGHTTVSH